MVCKPGAILKPPTVRRPFHLLHIGIRQLGLRQFQWVQPQAHGGGTIQDHKEFIPFFDPELRTNPTFEFFRQRWHFFFHVAKLPNFPIYFVNLDMEVAPALYLLPVNISDAPIEQVLPAYNIELLAGIRHFVVENLRTARRFLRKAVPGFPIDECTFFELNHRTDYAEIPSFLAPLRQGKPLGVMSEAGCPAVADPGAQIVAVAQREKLKVVPLVGPSSLLLSLMASGFNGQCFCFKGYLPVAATDKAKALKDLESESARRDQTQIFIETPYRNNKTIALMAQTLRPDTMVCVAADITAPSQSAITRRAADWKNCKTDYDKHPVIFLVYVPRR